MSKAAVLVCGHGSRDPGAIEEFEALAAALRGALPEADLAAGYLEFARPTIRDALAALYARGARRILAVPAMLFAASHVKNDLPWEVNSFAAQHPDVDIRFGRDLAIDAKPLGAAAARIAETETKGAAAGRAESLLLVVGRGTNDPDANSNIAKLARMLWEGMGFGWAEAAFSGVAQPRVAPALEHAVRLGFRRIVVFPYFLFTGVLVKRIYAETDRVAALHPEIEFAKAPYLRDHPLVLETFLDRIAEADGGDPRMNCQLCKYRARLVGYEADVGAVQAAHHHHVRGIGTDADHHHHHHGHHHP